MKNALLVILLASMFSFTTALGQAPSDDSNQQWKTRTGIGIGYEPFKIFFPSSTTLLPNAQTPVSFFIPIRTSNSLTIEPEIGLYTYSFESGSGGYSNTSSGSVIRFGVGVLATIASNSNVRLYAGPRAGLFLVKSKQSSSSPLTTSSNEMSETDLTLGGSIGAEYFFVESMSLGGEALLTYYSFGEPSYTPSVSSATSSRSMFTSNVVFFLRWYF